MEINIKLELQEVNVVLEALGQLPTSTNVWPLAAKIRAQAAQQMPKENANADQGDSAN